MLEAAAAKEIEAVYIPEGKFGPAMSALPERMQLFVLACLATGERMNYTKAAKLAGYEEGKIGSSQLKVQGHRLAHDPRVRAAITETAKNHFQASTLFAATYLVRAVANPKIDHKDRIKAATAILDRGGIHALTGHKLEVVHTDNRAEKLLKVIALAKAQGIDPRMFLGTLADVTDADYEMIDKVTPAASDATERGSSPPVAQGSVQPGFSSEGK